MPSTKPSKLFIRSYQVGFGDCFLLTFRYPAAAGTFDDRHVLIDCGSTGMPKKVTSGLPAVAKAIAQDCGNKLTAVIATHRHADHINGFATSTGGKGPSDVLRTLKPDLVLQPWTEDPDVAEKARSPAFRAANSKKAFGPAKFVAGLSGMHEFAALILQDVKRLGRALPVRTAAQLSFLGEENLANLAAVKNLMTMGKKNEYRSYGNVTALAKLLPGVKIHVLGPPTPKQYPEIEKQRSEDNAEFWHILGAAASALTSPGGISPFAARFAEKNRPGAVRWFIPRIIAAHAEQRLELVRILDDAMNNTSLILLFEIGKMKFLFPGDAQIENWSYALKDAPEAAANRTLLAQTDFYKVGHHGSLNATPKTLWALFAKKGPATRSGRLHTAVSTMAGKHGSTSRQTEVPRRPLVDELEKNSEFFTTQSLKKAEPSEPFEFADF
jgi:Metallo-beta-lactamase superfamily